MSLATVPIDYLAQLSHHQFRQSTDDHDGARIKHGLHGLLLRQLRALRQPYKDDLQKRCSPFDFADNDLTPAYLIAWDM